MRFLEFRLIQAKITSVLLGSFSKPLKFIPENSSVGSCHLLCGWEALT